MRSFLATWLDYSDQVAIIYMIPRLHLVFVVIITSTVILTAFAVGCGVTKWEIRASGSFPMTNLPPVTIAP